MTMSCVENNERPRRAEDLDTMDLGDEGVDGEVEDEEEEGVNEKMMMEAKSLPPKPHVDEWRSDRDTKESSGDSPRKHRSSSERRHHHNHSSSSHHRRRKASAAPGDGGEEGEQLEEGGGGGGRSRRRSDSTGDHHSDHSSSKRSSHRKHHDRRSSRSSHSQRSSRRSQEKHYNLDEGEYPTYPEDYLAPEGINPPSQRKSQAVAVDKKGDAEAEDGEILEDGELGDDDDDDVVELIGEEASSLDTSREDGQGSPSKLSGKEDSRGEKREKKKSDHKDKGKKDGDKRKRKKYVDVDKMEDEESPAPAWGSGYQGTRPKISPPQRSSSFGKQNRPARSNRGHQSPPGLYDSPSYSEESDEESMEPAGLVLEGYIDASVAVDEKEGIFKRGPAVPMKKKKRTDRDRLHGKRGRNPESGKMEGPPKKKPLVDMAMADRPVCKFFRDGKCAKGAGCQFNHDVEQPKRMEVCKYHLTVKGCHKERCLYMHEDFPCKYYHTGAQCFSGERCKFSHDQLTDESRKALEMRVAAEDIIDMDDPDYDYDYRSRNYDSRNRPSLLGSPPRRHDLKKIPSLFEIEVHPPGQSPKPSPQTVRPSGFYSEASLSPKPGSGISAAPNGAHGPGQGSGPSSNNSNNNGSGPNNAAGMMNNQASGGPMGPSGQQGPPSGPNQNPMSGSGLLQTPHGNMNQNMMGNSRMPGMPAQQQQQLQQQQQQLQHQQQQRPGGGPPMQFMNPAQMNMNKGQQTGNQMSPVLNMLGAIIREATMQQGPAGGPGNGRSNMGNVGPNGLGPNNMGPNAMGPNNMRPNAMGSNNMGMNNMGKAGPNMNSIGNAGGQGMNNMGNPGNMNSMGHAGQSMNNMGNTGQSMNNMGNMGPGMNNMGNAGPGMNNMGNAGPCMNNMGNAGPGMNNMGTNNLPSFGKDNVLPCSISNIDSSNTSMGPKGINPDQGSDNAVAKQDGDIGLEENDDMMDVDYRIKKTFDESEDNSQDLSDLHSIRRQLQEKIAQASEEEEREEQDEEMDEDDDGADDEGKMLIAAEDDGGLSPERNLETEEDKDQDGKPDSEDSLAAVIEIPAHLPKKQRELFKRIQHQQMLREKEKEKQEAQRAAEEADAKAEVDDWYSSDEDGEGGKAPKLTDVLKKLNEETAPKTTAITSSLSSLSSPSSTTSTSSSALPTSTASTFNIMQMINRIKNQVPPPLSAPATSSDGSNASPTVSDSRHKKRQALSPSSSPGQQMTIGSPQHAQVLAFPLQPLSVEPKVVSARPLKPLKYAVLKIALNMPKPYTHLPDGVKASDPVFRNDPRVKRHIHYLEKQLHSLPAQPKENVSPRRSSTEGEEKPAKLSDPRLKRAAVDPRKAKAADDSPSNSGSESARPTDPRLRGQAQTRPIDPRLARRAAAAGMMDPRLNRQLSQPDMNNQMMNTGMPMGRPMNNQMGGPANMQMSGKMAAMGMNTMGGPMSMGNQMNNMGLRMNMGGPMNNMGGPMNSMGGPMNTMGVAMNPVNASMAPMNASMNMGGPNRLPQGMGPASSLGVGMNRMGGPVGGPMGLMANRMPGSMMGVHGPADNMMSGAGPHMMGGNVNRIGGPCMGGESGLGGDMTVQADLNMASDPRLSQRSDPRSVGARFGEPRNSEPRFGDPRTGDPRSVGPRSSDPRSVDPRINDPRSVDPRSSDPRSVDPRINDPRSVDPRSSDPRSLDPRINDPRSLDVRSNDPRSFDPRSNDPRQRNKPLDQYMNRGDIHEQGNNRSDPRFLGKPTTDNESLGDPRAPKHDSRRDQEDVRNAKDNLTTAKDIPSMKKPLQLASSNREAAEKFMENLPSLMSSSSLPPLPTLSPPPSSSSSMLSSASSLPPTSTQSTSKDSDSEKQKFTRKFDYRNDPRFKRVKRVPGQRKSSMEYSSPLGGEESLPNTEEGVETSQYNSYTRPKTTNSKDPRSKANFGNRNTPSPALPDTLHDFPEMSSLNTSEPEVEPDLKVKDLFKTIDPTASPFC